MTAIVADKISKEKFLRLIDGGFYLDFIEASSNTATPDLDLHDKYVEAARAHKEKTWEDQTTFEVEYSYVPTVKTLYANHLQKNFKTIKESWHALADALSDKEWLMFWMSNYNLDMVSAYCEVQDEKEDAKTKKVY